MEYALKIEDENVQNAMKALDIDPEELLIKSYDDFGGPRVAEHIQELRYDYYTRKLKDLIRQIRLKIRELRIRASGHDTMSRQHSRSLTPEGVNHQKHWSQESTALIDTQNLRKRKLMQIMRQDQAKSASMATLEKIKKKGDKVKQMTKEAAEQRRLRNEARRLKHLEAIEKIKSERDDKHERLLAKLRSSMEEHRKRESDVENLRNEAVKQREQDYLKKQGEVMSHLEARERLIEIETEKGMEKFTNKIQRSEAVHEKGIRAVAEKAAKHIDNLIKASDNVERERRLMSAERKKLAYRRFKKLKAAETRRELIQSRPEDRSIKKARSQAALNRIQSERADLSLKTKELEDRIETSIKVLEERQEARRINIELKHEEQRLKEEDTMRNIRKKQRHRFELQEQVLLKQKELSEKIQAWKEDRARIVQKNQEIAIQAMKEREKLANEILQLHKKGK